MKMTYFAAKTSDRLDLNFYVYTKIFSDWCSFMEILLLIISFFTTCFCIFFVTYIEWKNCFIPSFWLSHAINCIARKKIRTNYQTLLILIFGFFSINSSDGMLAFIYENSLILLPYRSKEALRWSRKLIFSAYEYR